MFEKHGGVSVVRWPTKSGLPSLRFQSDLPNTLVVEVLAVWAPGTLSALFASYRLSDADDCANERQATLMDKPVSPFNAASKALAEARSLFEIKDAVRVASDLKAHAMQTKDERLLVDAVELFMRRYSPLGREDGRGSGQGRAGTAWQKGF